MCYCSRRWNWRGNSHRVLKHDPPPVLGEGTKMPDISAHSEVADLVSAMLAGTRFRVRSPWPIRDRPLRHGGASGWGMTRLALHIRQLFGDFAVADAEEVDTADVAFDAVVAFPGIAPADD